MTPPPAGADTLSPWQEEVRQTGDGWTDWSPEQAWRSWPPEAEAPGWPAHGAAPAGWPPEAERSEWSGGEAPPGWLSEAQAPDWSAREAPSETEATTRLSLPEGVDTTRIAVGAGRPNPLNGHRPGEHDEQLGRRMDRHRAGRVRQAEGSDGGTLRRAPVHLLALTGIAMVALGSVAAMAMINTGPFRDDPSGVERAPGGDEDGVPADTTKGAAASSEPGQLSSVALPAPGAPSDTQSQEPARPDAHTVASGETLMSIAAQYGLDWRLLFDANLDVERPDLLFKGQVLVIPAPDADLPRRELPKPPEPEPSEPPESSADPSPDPSPKEEAPADPPPAVPDDSVWDRLAQCESGGNWSINTGNGYYGGLQFSLSSWQAVGGTGYPHEHSREEQIRRGELLQAQQGWGAWPSCARKLGLL